MSNELTTSLIVTTYNWPAALNLTLQSVGAQTRVPDEVIIADDGSGQDTAAVVQATLGISGLSWRHVWHPDRGVRQSRIKNLAVQYCRGDYLIFVDHDVVLDRNFVADHLTMANPGFFLQGKRVLLPLEYTEKVLREGIFTVPRPWMRDLGNRKNTFRLPCLGRFLARAKRFETSLRGCNLSIYREDFIGVDGFDELYDISWGREDSDLCYRLFHAGIRVKTLWFLALQYHLYHGATQKWERQKLDSEIQRNLAEKRRRAVRGYSQLTGEGGIVQSSPGFQGKRPDRQG